MTQSLPGRQYSHASLIDEAFHEAVRMKRIDARENARHSRHRLTWVEARCACEYDFLRDTHRTMAGAVITSEQVYQGMTNPIRELTA